MLAGVPLIIASNTWFEFVEKLTVADQEWSTANQVLVRIGEKCGLHGASG